MTNHQNRSRRIWLTENGTVCLRCEDEMGGDIVREFWVPPSGGYVREIDERHPGTLGLQVCIGLARLGSTLSSTPDRLLDLIRREYRRATSAAKRESDLNG